jgi:hypothetical protein
MTAERLLLSSRSSSSVISATVLFVAAVKALIINWAAVVDEEGWLEKCERIAERKRGWM